MFNFLTFWWCLVGSIVHFEAREVWLAIFCVILRLRSITGFRYYQRDPSIINELIFYLYSSSAYILTEPLNLENCIFLYPILFHLFSLFLFPMVVTYFLPLLPLKKLRKIISSILKTKNPTSPQMYTQTFDLVIEQCTAHSKSYWYKWILHCRVGRLSVKILKSNWEFILR